MVLNPEKNIFSGFVNPEKSTNPEKTENEWYVFWNFSKSVFSFGSQQCKNGSMIWNHTDKAELTMKNFTENELREYLKNITDEKLYAYNVYQIEGEGRNLFANIEGDENTIMGLPIKKIKEYLKNYE